jgi:hypothetical protein
MKWQNIHDEFQTRFPELYALCRALATPTSGNYNDNTTVRLAFVYAILMQTHCPEFSLVQHVLSAVLMESNVCQKVCFWKFVQTISDFSVSLKLFFMLSDIYLKLRFYLTVIFPFLLPVEIPSFITNPQHLRALFFRMDKFFFLQRRFEMVTITNMIKCRFAF